MIRLDGHSPNDSTDTSRVMTLLHARVPLTLLLDLADPAGPDSRAILLEELVAEDVRRAEIVLPERQDSFGTRLDVC